MIIHTFYLLWLLYQSQLLLLSGLNNSHFFYSRVNNLWDFPGGAEDRNCSLGPYVGNHPLQVGLEVAYDYA